MADKETSTGSKEEHATGSTQTPSREAYYSELGLSTDANLGEVRKAYISLAKRYHPDKDGDGELFKKLNAAYVAIMEYIRNDGGSIADLTTTDMSDIFSGSTENKKSVTLKVPVPSISYWKRVLGKTYGKAKCQGEKGDKYIATVQEADGSNRSGSPLGPVHITVYHNGTILIQGSSYLLWHAECLPTILQTVRADMKRESPAAAVGGGHTPSPHSPPPANTRDRQTATTTDLSAGHRVPEQAPITTQPRETSQPGTPTITHRANHSGNPTPRQPADQDPKAIIDRLDALELHLVKMINKQHHDNMTLQLELKDKQIESLKSDLATTTKQLKECEQKRQHSTQECKKLNNIITSMKEDRATDIDKTLSQSTARFVALEKENEHLRETRSTAHRELAAVHERLLEKEAALREKDGKLGSYRLELDRAEEEIKDLNIQLRTAWEEGVEDFQLVRHTKDARKTKTLPQTPPDNEHASGSHSNTESQTHAEDNSANKPPNASGPNSGTQKVSNAKMPDHTPSIDKRCQDNLVISSSLGRDLQYWRILPGSREKVYVKPISGGKIEDVTRVIQNSKRSYRTITVLVGGNNISQGDSMDTCLAKFRELLDVAATQHPRTKINICEIPPRPALSIRHEIAALNQAVRDLCKGKDLTSWVPVQIDASDKFFVHDRVHLSRAGTAQLALDIRHALDPTRPAHPRQRIHGGPSKGRPTYSSHRSEGRSREEEQRDDRRIPRSGPPAWGQPRSPREDNTDVLSKVLSDILLQYTEDRRRRGARY